MVHILVLTTFKGPKPIDLECRHLDGNSANNNLNNLEWGTRAQNIADKIKHGTLPFGEKVGGVKLTNAEVIAIREMRKTGVSFQKIADRYNVCRTSVANICKNKTWRHLIK